MFLSALLVHMFQRQCIKPRWILVQTVGCIEDPELRELKSIIIEVNMPFVLKRDKCPSSKPVSYTNILAKTVENKDQSVLLLMYRNIKDLWSTVFQLANDLPSIF